MKKKVNDWRARFWAKVARRGPSECWLWLGGCSSEGYGQFSLKGRMVGAHRVAYAALNGRTPRLVRHTCDTPRCCNPAHLVAGSHADNMDDRKTRGRNMLFTGERNGRAKITDAMALRIFLACKEGRSQVDVARELKVKASLVFDIVNRRTHKHVTEGL